MSADSDQTREEAEPVRPFDPEEHGRITRLLDAGWDLTASESKYAARCLARIFVLEEELAQACSSAAPREGIGGPVVGECIPWMAYIDKQGYGRHGGRLAHRIVWVRHNGPIPPPNIIHHVCGNKACVNVAHLMLLTPRQHIRVHKPGEIPNGVRRAATHCKRGHPYDEENTAWTKYHTRRCRACTRDRAARRAEHLRQVAA